MRQQDPLDLALLDIVKRDLHDTVLPALERCAARCRVAQADTQARKLQRQVNALWNVIASLEAKANEKITEDKKVLA